MWNVLGTVLYYVLVVGLLALLLTGVKHTTPMAWSTVRKRDGDFFEIVLMALLPLVLLWMAVSLAAYAIGALFGADWRIPSP